MSPKVWYAPNDCVPPSHSVFSLNWMRSLAVPPNTMPPISPLPIGSAWFIHSVAGRSYQSTSAGSATSEVSTGRTTSTIGPRPARPAMPPDIPDFPPHAETETAASASAAPRKFLSCAIGRKSNKHARRCQQD